MARQEKKFAYNDPLPKRLRELIKQNGVTFESLADAIGTTRQTVGNWQTGKTIPDAISLRKMAGFFGVTTDYLLGLTDARTSEKDLRSAVDFAGLLESAVQRLAYVQDADNWLTPDGHFAQTQWMPEDKKVLSELISNDVLLKTVRAIQSYRANTRICIERQNIEEFGEVIEDSNVKGAKLAKFEVQEAFILYLAELRKALIEEAKAGDPDGKTNQKAE